jgi:NADP-dependent 3-hydroxy acid dehydrogenase YdfG
MIKTALVTGATSGGKTTAQILAQNNYKILLCGRREELEEAKNFRLYRSSPLTFDVRDKKSGFRKY